MFGTGYFLFGFGLFIISLIFFNYFQIFYLQLIAYCFNNYLVSDLLYFVDMFRAAKIHPFSLFFILQVKFSKNSSVSFSKRKREFYTASQ
jgi:hypothetical protein